MTARPWFRMYRKIINSRKVHDLRPELFKAWVFMLALTDDDGRLPDDEEVAFKLRIPIVKAGAIRQQLTSERFFDVGNDGVTAHDWAEHQHASDVSNDRVKRYRERRGNGVGNVTSTVTVTPPDTDTDTDTEKQTQKEKEARGARASQSKPAKGLRWPADAIVPEDWIAEGEAYRQTAKLPVIDLRAEALKFANYWAAKAGGGSTKIDWKRTWLNWVLSAKTAGGSNGRSGQHGQTSSHPLGWFAEFADEAARAGRGEPDA